MLTRSTVLEQIQKLPEQFSIDELMEKLVFLYKIEIAMEQSKEEKITPHHKIKTKYQKWIG